jgi:hypothetical protein
VTAGELEIDLLVASGTIISKPSSPILEALMTCEISELSERSTQASALFGIFRIFRIYIMCLKNDCLSKQYEDCAACNNQKVVPVLGNESSINRNG